MRITYKNLDKREIRLIEAGSVFEYNGGEFMLLNKGSVSALRDSIHFYAADLKDGSVYTFGVSTKVIPLDANLVIE